MPHLSGVDGCKSGDTYSDPTSFEARRCKSILGSLLATTLDCEMGIKYLLLVGSSYIQQWQI